MNKIYCCLPIVSLATMPANAKKGNPTRPNVIVILADDLGYADLSCYGATSVQTPNVDKLAADGLRFTNAHAVAATSTPSRYALLTGEYPWRKPGTDVAQGNAALIVRPEQFTLADLFKSEGYATAAVGKWHLGLGSETGGQDWNAPLPAALGDLGFDYSYIMAATSDRVPCVFIENGRVANYDASAPIEVSYTQNFAGEPTGRSNPELLYNLKPSHGHDQSIVNGISRIGYMKGGGRALWKDENIADSLVAHAVNFIGQHRDVPFFLYLCTNDVHVPRFPHQRFRGKSPMGFRGDAILQFDWTVGEILKTLKRLHLEDNTLIILTSDNGPVLDDGYQDDAVRLAGTHKPGGPFRGGKYSAFEAGTAVPFIVRWPERVRPHAESHALVSQIDFPATMAAFLKVRTPAHSMPDSQNQMAAWFGEEQTGREWVMEQAANHTLGLRTARWKYIEPHGGEAIISWGPKIETGYSTKPQLYDMTSPYETQNEAETHPDIVQQMREILQKTGAISIP